jgi:SAM-dependent methyltransferase
VTTQEAMELIARAVLADDSTPVGLVWADLGAGSGTFTFALAALLGATGRVIGVDRDDVAVESLRRGIRGRLADPEPGFAAGQSARITAVRGDFRALHAVDALQDLELDGALFANALHFDPDPAVTLAAAGGRLRPGGRLVVIEYQDRPPNPWVPHPLPVARLHRVADQAGLGSPRVTGERPSSYGGMLYCAWLPAG